MQSENQTEVVHLLAGELTRGFAEFEQIRQKRNQNLLIFLFAYMSVFAILGIGLYFYCENRVLKPFRKLRRFARDIAMGNLDIPLKMDRHGNFGAFTESFDLMREEIRNARENERAADRSKKELVASLSHDIKTPVASIKAATELMLVSARSEKEKQQLERINEKAEQINSLVTDLFHATLEELNALQVTVAEIHSTVIPELLKSADYLGKIDELIAVPECIVLADGVRLQQIFDNIVGNSYKYADTEIRICAVIEDDFLVVEIGDAGNGVSDEELPLLASKFYRGKNADDKTGYGLGLFICSYLLTEMAGELRCENRQGGFWVRVGLRLAGQDAFAAGLTLSNG
jgi:signal transduction histidine kinase